MLLRLCLVVLWSVLTVVMLSCNRNVLRVSDVNFNKQIDLMQNLVFELSHPAGADKLTGQWDSTSYIKFTPHVPGRFQWLDKNKLMFSPAYGFRPCTNYDAQLTDQLSKEHETDKLAFHTPFLQLNQARVMWVERGERVLPEMKLHFNYRVQPEKVVQLLEAKAGTKNLSFSLLKSAPSKVVVLAVNGLSEKADDATELEVKIKSGLACEESSYKTKEDLLYALSVPNPQKISIEAVKTEIDEDQGIIHLLCTHEVKDNSLNQLITIKNNTYYWSTETIAPDVYSVKKSEDGLEIKGRFQTDKQYEVIIAEQLQGIIGRNLGAEEVREVTFGATGTGVQFVSKRGLYLAEGGERNVAVRISNVEMVKVKVAKVYENNIQTFIRQNLGRSYYDYYDEGSQGNDDAYEQGYTSFDLNHYYDIDYFGDVIYEKEIAVNTLPKEKGNYVFNFNFDDPKKTFKGVYVAEIVSNKDYYARATKLLAISDIGLTVKKAKDRYVTFAHSLKTTQPMNKVKMTLISHNNQNVLSEDTDSKGIADFNDLSKKNKGFDRLTMVTARKDDDFNFIILENTAVPTSRFEVKGKQSQSIPYEAFMYGERDLYRPGETVHINALVRNQADLLPEKNLPVTLLVDYPNGQLLNKFIGTINEEGSFMAKFDLPTAAMTGRYRVTLLTGAGDQIAEYAFYAEEFTPDRLRVKIALDHDEIPSGKIVSTEADAHFFFGAPAAGRPYEVALNLARKDFKPKAYQNFQFQVIQKSSFEELRRTGNLNEKGSTTEKFEINANLRDLGLWEGKVLYTVYDESKRPVHRSIRFNVPTQPVLFGIQKFDRYVGSGLPLQIPIIGLNTKEQVVNGAAAQVKIVRFKYDNILRNRYGSYSYDAQKSEELVFDKAVTISGGVTPVSYIVPTSGEYQVRVSRPGAKNYVAWNFFAFGFGTTEQSFEINTDGEIAIETNKSIYKTGEKAEILFKTPFDGRLLIGIERHDVLEIHQIETEKRAAKLTLPLKDGFVPNVFISATLFRPHVADGIPLTTAHGFQKIRVEDQSKIDVAITAPEEVRSRSKQNITIRTMPNAEVTVAVVDEGILQLRNTPTPDPHGFFYADRALEVSTHDVYTYLFPEIGNRLAALKRASTGGDGIAGEMQKRINPFLGKRFKLVSFFSGRIKADGNGIARYECTLPQFAGALRIMAVAYKGKNFGSASKMMTVVDPVVLNTALPRFLSSGDTIRMPITIHNTTTKTGNGTVSLQLSGPIRLAGKTSATFQLLSKKESTIPFELIAKDEVGVAQIKVSVNVLGEHFSDETEISVRPATPYEKTSGSGSIAGGKKATIRLDAGDFFPVTTEAKLIVGTTPIVPLSGNLADLVQYPYGCVEQTISAAFPQLYFADLVPFMSSKSRLKKVDPPAHNVRTAIAKLQGLQLPNGGLAYWQGNTSAQAWASVYGLHFLTEAKKAQYAVPEAFYSRLTDYVKTLPNQEPSAFRASEDDNVFDRSRYGGTLLRRIYALYVLSLAGERPIATLNYYRTLKQQMDTDAKFLLACTYLHCGDENAYRSMVPPSYTTPNYPRETGETFSSPLRDQALVMNALMESDPNNPLIGTLAKRVSQGLKEERFPNTQELSFALLALGKLAKRNASSDGKTTWSVTLNGKKLNPSSQSGGTEFYAGKWNSLDVTTQGNGTVYYFWEVNGVRQRGMVTETDHLISVRREYLDRSGRKLGMNFRQNDLMVVHLTLQAQRNVSIENIVVSDLLPAGLEIENTRLTEMPGMDWMPQETHQTQADYIDYRDDRVHFFTGLKGEVKHFYYMVRAVSAGKFRLGPVSADAMYDGAYRSYYGAGIVQVTEK